MFAGSPNPLPIAPEPANSVPPASAVRGGRFLVSRHFFVFGILLCLVIVCSTQRVKSKAVKCV